MEFCKCISKTPSVDRASVGQDRLGNSVGADGVSHRTDEALKGTYNESFRGSCTGSGQANRVSRPIVEETVGDGDVIEQDDQQQHGQSVRSRQLKEPYKSTRSNWTAGRVLYSIAKGVLTNKLLWGVGLIALSAVCPWAIGAGILLGVGIGLSLYGTYANTKATYRAARLAGMSNGWAGALAGVTLLLNVVAFASAFLTFGASAAVSSKVSAFVQSTINHLAGNVVHSSAFTIASEAAAGAMMVGVPIATRIVRDHTFYPELNIPSADKIREHSDVVKVCTMFSVHPRTSYTHLEAAKGGFYSAGFAHLHAPS